MAVTESVVGANAGRSRGHNRQVVLRCVRGADRIGRAEIARASGLSTQAVSNIIADLLDDGLIVEGGYRSVSRGVPVVQYSLNPEGGFAAGIEVRPDVVFGALLNFCGAPVAETRRQVATTDRKGVARAVREMRAALVKRSGLTAARLLGVGVVMPGPFGETGVTGSASELPIWDDTPPEVWLSDMLGAPVLVENDANAAAIAERVSGVAQGLESYAFLYFGTGLGLGVVHKGRLMAGAFGNAGEIGTIEVPGRGGMIRLEDAVSRLSLARALADAGQVASNVDDLAALYDAGAAPVMDWLDEALAPLSAAVSMVENLFDPETIILGGAMPDNILDHLVQGVRLTARSVSNRGARVHPRLMRGASGRMTATLGAAALVVNQTFTPRIAPGPKEV